MSASITTAAGTPISQLASPAAVAGTDQVLMLVENAAGVAVPSLVPLSVALTTAFLATSGTAGSTAINVSSGQPGDLLTVLRETPANGMPPSYAARTINVVDLLASLLPAAIGTMLCNLPTNDGTAIPIWNDGGVLTLTTGFGNNALTPPPLTAGAFDASLRPWFESLPKTDPHDGVSMWNNGNVPTLSVLAGT